MGRVVSIKYLGVILDGSMSGEAHAQALISKCASRISFLYRYSNLLNSDCRRILCSALIQPYLDYCSSSWYSGLTTKLRVRGRIDVIQRRMVRYIHSFEPRHHLELSDFKRLRWMVVPDRVNYFKLIHVFKIKHGLAPSYLSNRFTSVAETHSYNTRGSRRNFSLSGDIGSLTSFSYTAIKLWNDIPSSLKEIDSLVLFKKRLREYLTALY